jgi:hypothetical protein
MIQQLSGSRVLHFTKIAVAFVVIIAARSADADIVINWPNVIVQSDNINPVSGFADVYFTLTGADAMVPPQIDAFNLGFQLASGTGFTFNVPTNGTANPVFGGALFIPPSDTYPRTNVRAANNGGPTALADLQGLVRANFTVAPGHVGQTYTINFVLPDTQLSLNGNVFNFTTMGGSVTVQAVPEPAAVFGMSAAALVSVGSVVVARQRKLARLVS